MLVQKDITVNITLNQLLCSQGVNNTREKPEILTAARKALQTALSLTDPAFVLKKLPVSVITENYLKIGPLTLESGECTHLLEQAVEAAIYVATIGGKLEQAVFSLSCAGNYEAAYWLDCAGVLILVSLDQQVRATIATMARNSGYKVGYCLSPGSLKGWPLEHQQQLCSVLDIEEIGVSCNNSCLLVPQKSVSGMVGMGPNYLAPKVDYPCHYCTSPNACWLKKTKAQKSITDM